VITSYTRMFGSPQKIFIRVRGSKAIGFIKIGKRKLFHTDFMGNAFNQCSFFHLNCVFLSEFFFRNIILLISGKFFYFFLFAKKKFWESSDWEEMIVDFSRQIFRI